MKHDPTYLENNDGPTVSTASPCFALDVFHSAPRCLGGVAGDRPLRSLEIRGSATPRVMLSCPAVTLTIGVEPMEVIGSLSHDGDLSQCPEYHHR